MLRGDRLYNVLAQTDTFLILVFIETAYWRFCARRTVHLPMPVVRGETSIRSLRGGVLEAFALQHLTFPLESCIFNMAIDFN